MAKIKFLEDFSEKIKDNKTSLLIGLGVLFLLYFLMSNKVNQEESLKVPSGTTSYPDSVTNANTIMDEVNENSNANTELIMDELGSIQNAINDYINKGKEDIKDKVENDPNPPVTSDNPTGVFHNALITAKEKGNIFKKG